MTLPNTADSLSTELSALGIPSGDDCHGSFCARADWLVSGWSRRRDSCAAQGAWTRGHWQCRLSHPNISDPATWDDAKVLPEWHATIRDYLPVLDPLTTPTTMGAIPEAFRTYPGTQRSNHPLVSVCALGKNANEITKVHSTEFCEGLGTPFEKLYDLDAQALLLGVGFNRCTSLHYAESLVPARRTTVHSCPIVDNGESVWVAKPDMANDDGKHFPVVGTQFLDTGLVTAGKVGEADAMLFQTRELVDFAKTYFENALD